MMSNETKRNVFEDKLEGVVMESFKIEKTPSGRRYFVVDNQGYLLHDDFTNGYIEINENWSHDYLNKFYEQFNFWRGATFMGILYLDVSFNNHPIMFNSYSFEPHEPTLDDISSRVKEEFRSQVTELIRGKKYVWVIGFDDNHIETLGREGVIEDTMRIANEMDGVVVNGCEVEE